MSRRATNPVPAGQPPNDSTVVVEETAQARPATASRAPAVSQSANPATARPSTVVESAAPSATRPTVVDVDVDAPNTTHASNTARHNAHNPFHLPHLAQHGNISSGEKRKKRRCPRWCCWCWAIVALLLLGLILWAAIYFPLMKSFKRLGEKCSGKKGTETEPWYKSKPVTYQFHDRWLV
jgi:hypothetical protein